jgi:hypothetical protein
MLSYQIPLVLVRQRASQTRGRCPDRTTRTGKKLFPRPECGRYGETPSRKGSLLTMNCSAMFAWGVRGPVIQQRWIEIVVRAAKQCLSFAVDRRSRRFSGE